METKHVTAPVADAEPTLKMPSREYALGAIAELRNQLEHAQTDNRRGKLQHRIEQWEKKLPTLE